MELEEMKNSWEKLSKKVEKQEILTNQMIEKMTQQRYHSKLNKIGYSEYIGTLVCYIGAAYLSVNLLKIEGTTMQVFGGIAIALLLVLPIISLQSVRAMRSVNIASGTYVETIQNFARQKIRFQKLQKLNVSLGLLLMLLSIPVLAAIQGRDLSQTPYFWTLIFPLFVLVFLAFAYWVLKSYNRALHAAEMMLSDIKP